jgi:hypothetical protein
MAPSDKVLIEYFRGFLLPWFRIRSRIRSRENLEFLGLQNPDPEPLIYVRLDPDPDLDPYPGLSITKQEN